VVQLETCDDVLHYAELVAEPAWQALGLRLGKDMGKVRGGRGGGRITGHWGKDVGKVRGTWGEGVGRGGRRSYNWGADLSKALGRGAAEGDLTPPPPAGPLGTPLTTSSLATSSLLSLMQTANMRLAKDEVANGSRVMKDLVL